MKEPRTEAGKALHFERHKGCEALGGPCEYADRIAAIEGEAATPADTGLPDLDVAWREAEAALREGWELTVWWHRDRTVVHATSPARRVDDHHWTHDVLKASGPTLAAALHELARRLSGPHDGEEGK